MNTLLVKRKKKLFRLRARFFKKEKILADQGSALVASRATLAEAESSKNSQHLILSCQWRTTYHPATYPLFPKNFFFSGCNVTHIFFFLEDQQAALFQPGTFMPQNQFDAEQQDAPHVPLFNKLPHSKRRQRAKIYLSHSKSNLLTRQLLANFLI